MTRALSYIYHVLFRNEVWFPARTCKQSSQVQSGGFWMKRKDYRRATQRETSGRIEH